MTIRIGINGFGRIGRIVLRAAQQYSEVEVVGINDIAPIASLAHLLKYDSTHGRFGAKVTAGEKSLTIADHEIPVFASRQPSEIPWGNIGADIILECSGIFTERDKAAAHLASGAKKVIISAPATNPDATFVYGVNHTSFDPNKHSVVSNASCTTNCLAPMAYVLHKKFGIESGFMTTIHSYTNDQQILDAPHKDLRRTRAAATNQIPTSTGAAKALGLVLPELNGKLDGFAIRVPTINVSCTDLVVQIKKPASVAEVNAALKEASLGNLKGILGFEEDPLVSSDFMGDPRSSIIDASCTKVIQNMVKVLSWYDNEAGFSHRMLDMAQYIGERSGLA